MCVVTILKKIIKKTLNKIDLKAGLLLTNMTNHVLVQKLKVYLLASFNCECNWNFCNLCVIIPYLRCQLAHFLFEDFRQ